MEPAEVEVARGPRTLDPLVSSTDESIDLPKSSPSLADSSDDSLPGVSHSMNQPDIGTPSPVDQEVDPQSPAVSSSDSLHGVSIKEGKY